MVLLAEKPAFSCRYTRKVAEREGVVQVLTINTLRNLMNLSCCFATPLGEFSCQLLPSCGPHDDDEGSSKPLFSAAFSIFFTVPSSCFFIQSASASMRGSGAGSLYVMQ